MKVLTSKISRSMLMAVLLILGMSNALGATNPPVKQSLFDLMYSDDILEVTMEMDLQRILSDRRIEEKLPLTFSFVDNADKTHVWQAKVSQRGRYRRTKCEAMPPLKLDFKKGQLEELGLAGFDDMKLVTHCVSDEALAKQLLLKEFLAYKMYNQITEESFRVQLLKITYIDSNTGKKDKQFGFLIEDTAELRARLHAEKWDKKVRVDSSNVDQEGLNRVALFQYLIANIDWNLDQQHNVKVLKRGEKALVIPYDFDFSGLVLAPYATVSEKYGQKSLKDRVYLGGEDTAGIQATYELFSAEEDNLRRIVKKMRGLNAEHKIDVLHFLKAFFDEPLVINHSPKGSI